MAGITEKKKAVSLFCSSGIGDLGLQANGIDTVENGLKGSHQTVARGFVDDRRLGIGALHKPLHAVIYGSLRTK